MNNYKFNFNPKNCNKIYFDELFLLLKAIDPSKEKFKRIPKDAIRKLDIKCENEFNSCTADEFFFENKKQIILGRFFDTIGCFYKCTKYYFSMAMEPYSLFKNDVFIRYIIDKPKLYINNSKKIELEDVFPVRIVLSTKHFIPTYAEKKMKNIKEYTFDTVKKMFALSDYNLKIINRLPRTSILKKIITENFPINHVISRELCILYYMKLHFYIVVNEDKTIKPFILVSKYRSNQIREICLKYNKKFPRIRYLFKKIWKRKSPKKVTRSKRVRSPKKVTRSKRVRSPKKVTRSKRIRSPKKVTRSKSVRSSIKKVTRSKRVRSRSRR